MSRQKPRRVAHPRAVRVMHWIGVYAMGCMIFSGWEIYNASPSLPFLFPHWAGLGGWLGGALAWHLSAMWLLLADGVVYLIYGFASGHFRRDLRPPSPAALAHDLGSALHFRLKHRSGHYNAVQRLLYGGVVLAVILQTMTGLAIWKPVQFGWLAGVFGGYPVARGLHLAIMLGIVAFVVLHVTLVAIHPSTLKSMVVSVPTESVAKGEESP
ncbi:MAG TPA: cytochrome b/b6 domain-containing protein [Acidisoma sp.]|uniref:cytochrome b/b6 domain-containing protein n=1 Tax=Acidisoma sp. TaxID=1872115 RepID=UPI002B747641|nr:cytochrome b/b6 domain-containing protein [Acidisoma sp.]HTH99997.1 cytochrome b/b6 domain-containing protein [Acidisoma sp.]